MKEELREILLREGWTMKELAGQLLITPQYVRKSLMKDKGRRGETPNWVRAFVLAYKLGLLTGMSKQSKLEK